MKRVLLVHWKEAEGRERVSTLRAAGLRVEYEPDGAAALRAVRDDLPDAVVIDLTRLPSHGRTIAHVLRQSRKTRALPLVFVGGDPAKLERIRAELPDAAFTAWPEAVRTIERVLAAPPRAPVVPRLDPLHTDKPVTSKLGLKPDGKLALVAAPRSIDLGPLPEGARLVRGLRGKPDLVLWFVKSEAELRTALPRIDRAAGNGIRIWIAWPKKGASIATDLTQHRVRALPKVLGLIDYKICALSPDWSGMCFGRRRG